MLARGVTAAAAFLVGLSLSASAQEYPVKPVRIVVPVPPGGANDTLTRLVPTMTEAGFPGVEVASWYGLVGPAGLPADVLAKLDAEVKRVSHSNDLRERLLALGYEPMPMSAGEFGAFLKTDRARWSKVVREAGIRLQP